MALTFDQWKLGYGLTLIEEIAKECSTQVLVKVMLECQLMKQMNVDEEDRVMWLAWTYGAFNRWANGEDCLDEIEVIRAGSSYWDTLDQESARSLRDTGLHATGFMYMLCRYPDLPYSERVVVDGVERNTKKAIVASWLSWYGVTGDMIRSVMPLPPKNPDQEYCIIDETLVGCCNLFEQSEEIQYKWDVKKSFYGA